MSTAAEALPSAPLSDDAGIEMTMTRRPAWRFSIRTLLIAMAVVGAILAAFAVPIGSELRRAQDVQRQLKVFEDQGISAVTTPREQENYSLWLTRRVWRSRHSLVGHEFRSLFVVEHRRTYDIITLPEISSVDILGLRYGEATCSDPNFSQPRIRNFHYLGNPRKPTLEPDTHLLLHFPNVEKVEVGAVPADTHSLRDLAQCAHLKDLRLDLRDPAVLPFASAPLRGLKQLEALRIKQIPEPDDWSFLADMQNLSWVDINPLGGGQSSLGTFTRLVGVPVAPREKTPLHHLAQLPKLRYVSLDCTPAYSADLAKLAANAPLEFLGLEHIPEGPAALAALRKAPSLVSMRLKLGQFDDLKALTHELRELKQVKELICEFRTLTLEHVAMLEQLTQLEDLRITTDGYTAGAEGVKRLSALPLHGFYGQQSNPHCVTLRPLAAQKGQAAPLARWFKHNR